MEHVHSILIKKEGNKFINYYDKRWNMYLFPNIKGNNVEDIKNKFKCENVKFLFDKVHDKYSIPNDEIKTYHHYFYEIDSDIEGELFTLDELLCMDKVKENNSDIISFIKEFYNI